MHNKRKKEMKMLKNMGQLNQIAIPLIINAAFGTLIALINQGMVGQVIGIYAGAIGQVTILLFTLAGVLGAIAIAFNINGSKARVENNEEFQEYFSAGIWLAILLGAAILILLLVSNQWLLQTLYGLTGQRLIVAKEYLVIMSAYTLLQLVLFIYSSLFKILRKTKFIFICSTVSTLINVLLNYLLIFGNWGFPQLGVQGAAWATMISMLLNVLLYHLFAKPFISYRSLKSSLGKMKFLLRQSYALMGQEILEGSLFVVGISVIMERIGGLEATGYFLIIQILNLLLIPTYMYATALLTLFSASENRKLLRVALLITHTVTALTLLPVFIFRIPVLTLLNKNIEVVQYASQIFLYLLLAHLFAPIQTIFKALLQAQKRSGYVLISSFCVNLCAFLIMMALVFIFEWREYGVFFGLFINHLLLFIAYCFHCE
jgi:multidrug efflux pump